MLDIFVQIYDTIFPPHESIVRLKSESLSNFNRHLHIQTHNEWIALSDYQNPYIKAAITANKFHKSNKAAKLLAALLDDWLKDIDKKNTILVPIPLSITRLKSRGFNQVTRILKHNQSGLPIVSLLSRIKDTVPQTSLPRTERLKNLNGAFAVNKALLPISPTTILLIDDVTTTGTTLSTAQKALRDECPNNCKIICVALAH